MRAVFRLLLLSCLALPAFAAEINVFAAASLSDALKEIAQKYEPASGNKLLFNFAASSVLARQIKEGAPADLFFSADEAKVSDLAQADRVVSSSRRSLLGNTLVIVVPRDSTLTIAGPADLARPGVTKLALAEPQTVPAGIYARSYLEKLELWPQVAAKVIPTENVRACLAAVESGNVSAGIVYKTDALIAKGARIAFEVPAEAGPRISYPVVLVKASRQPEAAADLLAYLLSPDAQVVFEKYGFIILH